MGFSILKHTLAPTDIQLTEAITARCRYKSNQLTKLAVAQWLCQRCNELETSDGKVAKTKGKKKGEDEQEEAQ